jgi:calcineurin-like phosphoesterase family protein
MKLNPTTRQGSDPEQMNELIVSAWNNTVNENDHVFLLGDVSFGKESSTWDMIHRLNGKIHLIRGNHDQVILKSSPLKCQFVEVLDYKEINVDGVKVCMMHYPIEDWNGGHRGSYMLHGHTHGSINNSVHNSVHRRMDVGIDARDDNLMIPFSWNDIHTRLSSRTNISHGG